MTDAARLSRLLFDAREAAEMLAEIVETRSGRTDTHHRRLVVAIDTYRAEQGWSPHGFGGEA
jgi:hypothetical protein